MRSVVVHIGMPKTASTSLQAFLRINARALSERGLHFPDRLVYPDGHAEYGLIALSAAGEVLTDAADRYQIGIADLDGQRQRAAELSVQADALLPASGTVILSSESLSYWLRTPAARGALDDWLCARFDRVGYVILVRPVEEFVLSNYAEAVRRGLDQSLETYVANGHFQPVAGTALAWRQQFGPRVRVRAIADRTGARRNVYADFLDLVGVALTSDFAVPRARNASPSALQLQVLRWCNRTFGPRYKCQRGTRTAINSLVALAARLPTGKRPLRLTECQKLLTLKRFPRDVLSLVDDWRTKETDAPWPPVQTLSALPGQTRDTRGNGPPKYQT